MGSRISITLSLELLRISDGDDDPPIRIASAIYRNVSNVFTGGIDSK